MASPVPGRSGSRLWGWESIAEYLDCDPKTARKLAQQGLPVLRESELPRARVFAYPGELDRWMANRVVASPSKALALVQAIDPPDRAPSTQPPEPTAVNERPRPDRRLLYLGLACLVLVLTAAAYSVWPRLQRLSAPQRLAKAGRIFSRGTSEGQHLVTVPVPAGTDRLVATPDGQHFFTATLRYPLVYRYDYPTWKRIEIDAQTPVVTIATGPDANVVYCGTPWGIRSLQISSGRQRDYQLGGMVSSMVLSPDGNTLYAALGRLGVVKVAVDSGEVTPVVTQPAPEYIALDPSGEKLYISYQNGGPGGRDGHDTVEIRNLRTGAALNSPPGPPLVGGPLSYSPATDQVWAQMWDACYTPKYDHEGCPAVPSAGFQIFRGSDLKNIKTLSWQDRGGQAAHFPGDGQRALVPGPTLRTFNSQTFEVIEELITPTQTATSSEDGRRVFVLSIGHVLVSEVTEIGCTNPPAVAAQAFAFDGTLNDSVEVAHFRPSGTFEFVPGRVGQALRLRNGEARMISPSSFRFGDGFTENVSVSFWFRGRRTGHLIKRDSNIPWRIDWVDGQLYAHVGDRLKLGSDAPANVWHHVALSRDRYTYRLFFNGRLAGAGESETQRGGDFVGDFITSGDHDLDEFMTFGSVLTPEAVAKLAAAGPGCFCP